MNTKDTYKFQMKLGLKVIYRGVTGNLLRTEQDFRLRYPDAVIKQIGRRTTRQAALKWLHKGGRRPYGKKGVE